MKKVLYIILAAIALISATGSVNAQTDFRIQSVFLYNFTRLIAWPADYQSGDFIVATYGNSGMNREVQEMAETKRAGNQSIRAVNFRDIEDIAKCHILYVPANQSRRIGDIVAELKAKNIHALVVTDSRNAISNGAVINFTIVDSRQRFELSADNARSMGLNPGGEISRLAILAD